MAVTLLPPSPDHSILSPGGGSYLYTNGITLPDGSSVVIDYYDNGDRKVTSTFVNGWFPAGQLIPGVDAPPPEAGLSPLGWLLLLGAGYYVFFHKD